MRRGRMDGGKAIAVLQQHLGKQKLTCVRMRSREKKKEFEVRV